MAEPRFVIVHGHFYQPPRESPWTGLITPEPGAAPFGNWNERILSECYTANAHAHIMEGRVARIRNNYEWIDFNFGPTLASWIERHGKSTYHAFTRADRLSANRLGGHGNAIAQAYNHSILPLLGERDRAVQVAWGIEDFVYRFGRRPEGMWMPECAMDEATLAALARAGIRFTIVAPEQGAVSGADEREAGPFLWRGPEGLQLAIFRFDRRLSSDVSFGDALTDGARLAEWSGAAATAMAPGAALLIATDGETFGHHKKTGAAELARALMLLERRDDVVLTNCAHYLSTHPARGDFKPVAPSAWSCAHGVGRWCSNCGCRLDPNTTQEWRGPLREAMDMVKNHASAVYDRNAPELAADSGLALRESIRLAIDSRPATREDFFRRYKVSGDSRQERLSRLFEMERAGQATLTSCGWFFDDFGGPEGRIVLKWAARTLEIAREFAPDVESELMDRLRAIRSNRREIRDAAGLYLSLKTREARGRV